MVFCLCLPLRLVPSCLIAAWLLLWPVTAAAWGALAVARQSLILLLYILISNHCRTWCSARLVSADL